MASTLLKTSDFTDNELNICVNRLSSTRRLVIEETREPLLEFMLPNRSSEAQNGLKLVSSTAVSETPTNAPDEEPEAPEAFDVDDTPKGSLNEWATALEEAEE